MPMSKHELFSIAEAVAEARLPFASSSVIADNILGKFIDSPAASRHARAFWAICVTPWGEPTPNGGAA